MAAIKVNSVIGTEVLINPDSIRMVIPESETRSIIVFSSGDRLDVSESIIEMESKLND